MYPKTTATVLVAVSLAAPLAHAEELHVAPSITGQSDLIRIDRRAMLTPSAPAVTIHASPAPLHPEGVGCSGGPCAPVTITSFPYAWVSNPSGNKCVGDIGNTFTFGHTCNDSCNAPPFAPVSTWNSTLHIAERACNGAWTGQMFVENYGGSSYDGDAAVGFAVSAPTGTTNLNLTINANVVFQYYWVLHGQWPESSDAYGALIVHVRDADTGEVIIHSAMNAYSVTTQKVWGGDLKGTTGDNWFHFTNGLGASGFGKAGHNYVIWIWAENYNNSTQINYGDGLSAQVNSVTYSWQP